MKTFTDLLTANLQAHFEDVFDPSAPRTLTEPELLREVLARYENVSSKSQLLKSLRSDNFKVSQQRVYTMYSEVCIVWRETLAEFGGSEEGSEEDFEYAETEIYAEEAELEEDIKMIGLEEVEPKPTRKTRAKKAEPKPTRKTRAKKKEPKATK